MPYHLAMAPCMERVKRIELSQSAWKAEVLPLNYTRMEWWGETDSNHRTRRELSYSQPRLATSLLLHQHGGG